MGFQLQKYLKVKTRPLKTTYNPDIKLPSILDSVVIENPSGKCAKLHTVAASNNIDHASQSLLLLVRAIYIYIYCCSSRTSRSWWVTHSTQRQPERLQQQSTCYVQSGAQPGILFGRGQSLTSSDFKV